MTHSFRSIQPFEMLQSKLPRHDINQVSMWTGSVSISCQSLLISCKLDIFIIIIIIVVIIIKIIIVGFVVVASDLRRLNRNLLKVLMRNNESD